MPSPTHCVLWRILPHRPLLDKDMHEAYLLHGLRRLGPGYQVGSCWYACTSFGTPFAAQGQVGWREEEEEEKEEGGGG